MRRWCFVGAPLVAGLFVFTAAPAGRGSVAHAHSCVFDVTGQWVGITLGSPVPALATMYDQGQRHFLWQVTIGGSTIATGSGNITGADNGAAFHIAGVGFPNNPARLTRVEASGSVVGLCPTAAGASGHYTATYTDGTTSTGPVELVHLGASTA